MGVRCLAMDPASQQDVYDLWSCQYIRYFEEDRSSFFFLVLLVHSFVLVFCDHFFFELVKNYDSVLRYNLCKIFYSLARSPFRIFLLFYNNLIFILPLYFQWLYLRGTKLPNFHNFLTFSLYYMYYNSISIHSFSMFMSLEGLFKTISYIMFEEKISKFQKKNNLTFVYINYHERVKFHVLLDFSRIEELLISPFPSSPK